MIVGLKKNKEEQFKSFTNLIKQVAEQNSIDKENKINGSQITNAIMALSERYKASLKIDDKLLISTSSMTLAQRFILNYGANFLDEQGNLIDVSARSLWITLRKFSRDTIIPFEYKSVQQFIQRFSSEAKILEEVGFNISTKTVRGGKKTYSIRTAV